MNTGDILRRFRDRKGITQRALAEKLGISFSYMCDLEKNRRSPPPDLVVRIREATGLTAKQLGLRCRLCGSSVAKA